MCAPSTSVNKWANRTLMLKKYRILLPVVALLIIVAASGAFARIPVGRLVTISIDSAALKGNMLGDPSVQEADVYLPPGYVTDTAKRYPVVYLLHGYTGVKESWTKFGYQGLKLADSMDALIAEGKSKEMIIVAPNAKNAFLGSFYTDSPVTGGWATYISKELVERIDREFRTISDPSGRGIAGHSMGGYGAMILGMTNPKVYGAIYALSPCCMAFEGDIGPEAAEMPKAIAVTDLADLRQKPAENLFTTFYTGLAAAFSPNPGNKEFYVSYPFKMENGKVVPNEPAYSEWRARMPLYLVEEYRENLHGLRGLAFDVGENEEYPHISQSTRELSQKLAELKIPHTFSVYPVGDHSGKIRERLENFVIPFFSRTLADAR